MRKISKSSSSWEKTAQNEAAWQPNDDEKNVLTFDASQSVGFNIQWNEAKWTFGDSSEEHYGPTVIHRRSWVFMEAVPWTGIRRLPHGGQIELF